MAYEELTIEGRNAVIEAFRAGKTVDKIFVLEGCKDGPIQTVLREAKKQSTVVNFVKKERLDQLSETGKHQGVIAHLAAYEYSTVEEIMDRAAQKGEAPFVILLDGIEDPHNLGSIIRTANQAGAHGVIIPKRRAVGLTATVAKASAGAIHYTPVAKVTNLVKTMEAVSYTHLDVYKRQVINTWYAADNQLTEALMSGLDRYNNIFMMADSGARGSQAQIKQLAGCLLYTSRCV